MPSSSQEPQGVIERARKAALVAYEIEGEKFLANPTGEPQLQFVTEAADAAALVVLEHLRARYLDEAMEDVPMIDFIEPLLAELKR
jgi:hypothetical protein